MRRTLATLLIATAAATLLVATTGSPAGAGSGCSGSQAIIIDIDANGGDYENTTPAVPTVFLELDDDSTAPHTIDFQLIPQTWGVVSASIEWVDSQDQVFERTSTYDSPVVMNTFSVGEEEDFSEWGAIATFNVVNCGGGETTTTTTGGSTTSTTAGGAVSPTTAAQGPDTLPRTGSSTNLTLSLFAAAALATGTGALVIARRLRASH